MQVDLTIPAGLNTEPNFDGVTEAIGRAVFNHIRTHLIGLNAQRHEHGTPGFYEAAARGTFNRSMPPPPQQGIGFTQVGGVPAVVVNKLGIRMRLLGTAGLPGGVLRAKPPNQYLTIPAQEAAYGHKARDMVGLRVVFGRQRDTGQIGPIALAAGGDVEAFKGGMGRGRKEKWKKLKVAKDNKIMFWLRRVVFQAADPSVMPSTETLEAVGAAAGRRFLELKDRGL